MSSDTPRPDEGKEETVIPSKPTRRKVPSIPAGKIKEQSKSRNSYLRLWIVAGIALGLVLALLADIIVFYMMCYRNPVEARPYNGFSRDILLVISSLGAYLLGKGGDERKED